MINMGESMAYSKRVNLYVVDYNNIHCVYNNYEDDCFEGRHCNDH